MNSKNIRKYYLLSIDHYLKSFNISGKWFQDPISNIYWFHIDSTDLILNMLLEFYILFVLNKIILKD